LGSEEIEVRSSVAVAFEPLDARDVALDGAGAVLWCQAVDDGWRVAAHACGEAARFGQVVGFR
jgi:hypothetical protein